MTRAARPAFIGRVDWRALPTSLAGFAPDPGLSVAGLELSVREGAASVACASHGLVLCVGRPHFADAGLAKLAAERGPAAACLESARARGDRFTQDLGGHFAVVSLDVQRRMLAIATDRFATRPVCWLEHRGEIAFSDRADSLGREAEPQAILEYLYFHAIPTPQTFFRGVRRMPPGHVLVATPDGAALRRDWIPRFDESTAPSFAATKDEFRAAIERAVGRVCEQDAVGCYLSGGTDSSTVAGLVGRVTDRPARTFSIGFDAQGYDEMRYARIAAKHFRTDHHEYYVTPRDVVDGIPVIAASYDQPFGNSSALPALYCAREAGRAGVTRLLAGDGGDELFGGNSRYARQKIFEAYALIPEALRSGVVEPLLLNRAGLHRLALLRKAESYVRQAILPMPERANAYNPLVRIGVEEVLSRDFIDQVDVAGPARHEREVYRESSAQSLVNRMLQYDWRFTLADNDLPKVYGTAAIAGLEVAFPLLDDDLVDLSLRLPPGWKVKGTKLRYFFKEALRGFLPDEIIAKRKHGFGLPFGVWTVRDANLMALARSSLESLARRGFVREAFLRDLLDTRIHEHPGYYGEMVWLLVMLEQWLGSHGATAGVRFPERRAA